LLQKWLQFWVWLRKTTVLNNSWDQ
jgi:hypothetical protein